jgi:hypothetical protein
VAAIVIESRGSGLFSRVLAPQLLFPPELLGIGIDETTTAEHLLTENTICYVAARLDANVRDGCR